MKIKEIRNTIHRALTKGDIFPKIFTLMLIKMGYSNYALKSLEVRNKMFNRIEKKYSKKFREIHYDVENQTDNQIIWICWLQGIDNAPEIVQACIASVRRYMKNWKINFVDENNFGEYINIPGKIVDKWKKGIIGNAHFSDIIRLELLVKYGGIWIDSTVMLAEHIPEYIVKSDFFLFMNENSFDTRRPYENWFIRTKSNNRILKTIRDMLYMYWEKENKCKEYFIWNLCAYLTMDKYRDDWNKVYNIPANICYLVDAKMTDKFDEDYWNVATLTSPIQKLSYKHDFNGAVDESFYSYIVKHYNGSL